MFMSLQLSSQDSPVALKSFHKACVAGLRSEPRLMFHPDLQSLGSTDLIAAPLHEVTRHGFYIQGLPSQELLRIALILETPI
jgi:hypothetical protein